MRIAYLTQSYPPMISGAAIVVEGLARAMANRGHQVLVIAASERGPAYCIAEEKLTVLRMESLHNPLRVGQRFLLYPRCSMMKTLREFDPEMIHAHEPLQLGLLGSEYAGEAKIPIILTVHQTPSFVASYLPNILRACVTNVLWIYARWFSRKVTSMITPTQTISELFTQMTGVSANTISSGINLEIFHPTLSGDEEAATRQKWNLPSSVPILLHVGRLDVEKRVERVIQAAAGALHQTDAHLLIVGDGSRKNNLIKLCDELGITARVHFTGFVSAKEDLSEIYRAATLFVTASEIETQGIVLLESAASGLPIVAVRATCIHEIVHNGINGYLIESGDIHGMSNAITLLVENTDQARILGRASRALAAKHEARYTWDAHERLYSDLARQAHTKRLSAPGQLPCEWWKV